MSETAERPQTASEQVDAWLAAFNDALERGDAEAASALFLETSFWRDLVAFTWNIRTVEGPAGVRDMLEHTLGHVRPRGFRTTEEPAEADGVTEAWLAFETEAGRGHRAPAAARRRGVDAADHAAGAQGPRGAQGRRSARWAPSTARTRAVRRGSSGASARRASSATTTQPYVLVDRRRPGRDRARGAAAPARRPDDHRRPPRAARRRVAQPLQVALPARPGLVRPPAVHQVPGQLAGLLAEGQDRRLARDRTRG